MFQKEIHKLGSRTLQRLRLQLVKYTLQVDHILGKEMYVADLLSRSYIKDEVADDPAMEEVMHSLTTSLPVSGPLRRDLVKFTEQDSTLQSICHHLKKGWPSKTSQLSDNLIPYFKIRDQLFLEDGILFFNHDDATPRIIVPAGLRKAILVLVHGGHLGIDKCISRAKQVFYWPRMIEHVASYVKECLTCAKVNPMPRREPLHSRELPELPWEKISMDIASYGGKDYLEGHKGLSPLMLLEPYLDLREGQAQDDLHQDHEGSAADITNLLLTTLDARVNRNMANVALLRAIDTKMLSIKTPSRISRKPRSIAKMSSYTGSEWRNWLFYYCVPCLLGLIKPEYLDILASLSHDCYLLSQDSIEPEHIDQTERLLRRVATRFENTFGVGRVKYNLHVTTMHKVRSVRNLGNPFAYSTYNFESLHRKVIGKVTSPKGAIMQVIIRSMLYFTVSASQYDERLPEDVRMPVEDILNPYQLQKVPQVGHHMYVVGRGTEREVDIEEAEVMAREGIHANNIVEYGSVAVKSTRYWSSSAQNPNIKSDDSFIYTSQETFCTIRNIICFLNDNGEEKCGAFVVEHDVAQVVPQ
ncbi:hypothetical protein FOCC_FOCC012384 [Frankliniella occidentalis]|nr:hypothetical protein FOCC_FOCC012384 [Frankliniella occidentalis]